MKCKSELEPRCSTGSALLKTPYYILHSKTGINDLQQFCPLFVAVLNIQKNKFPENCITDCKIAHATKKLSQK